MTRRLSVADFPLSPAELAKWDGWCMELVDELLTSHPNADVLWIDLPFHPTWTYHAVVVLDGIVYDAWHPSVCLPPAEYVREVFGVFATWEINPGGYKVVSSRRAPLAAESAS